MWMPRRGYIPVHALDGGTVREAGRLKGAGSANWFVCQTARPGGRAIRHRDSGYPQYTNVWWARTLSDTGAWGWVSEIYFQGGANDERDARLRECSASEAAQAGTSPPSGPVPAPPPPGPPTPAPTTAPTPTPAPPPGLVLSGNPDCRPVRTGERANVTYRLIRRVLTFGSYSNGHPQLLSETRSVFDIGEVSIRLDTCRSPQWGWRLLPGGAVQADSTGINDEGLPRGREYRERGFGVRIQGGLQGDLDVIVPRCRQRGTWQGTYKTLVGLPWPGPWKLSGVTWLAGNAVQEPDPTSRCIEFARMPIKLGVSSAGRLTIRASDGVPLQMPSGGAGPTVAYEIDATVRARPHRSTD